MKRLLITLVAVSVLALVASADAGQTWRTVQLRNNTTGTTSLLVGASADTGLSRQFDIGAALPAPYFDNGDDDGGIDPTIPCFITTKWTSAATVPNSPDTLIVYMQGSAIGTDATYANWNTAEVAVAHPAGAISIAAGGAVTSTVYIYGGRTAVVHMLPLRYQRLVAKNVGTQTAVTDLQVWLTYPVTSN